MDIVASSIFSSSFFSILLGFLLESALKYKPTSPFLNVYCILLVTYGPPSMSSLSVLSSATVCICIYTVPNLPPISTFWTLCVASLCAKICLHTQCFFRAVGPSFIVTFFVLNYLTSLNTQTYPKFSNTKQTNNQFFQIQQGPHRITISLDPLWLPMYLSLDFSPMLCDPIPPCLFICYLLHML